MAPDIANETAKLWKEGRGAELYDSTARRFKSLFGEQMGRSLFCIVREDELGDWEPSIVGMVSFCKCSWPG